jgi:hypothetical protein
MPRGVVRRRFRYADPHLIGTRPAGYELRLGAHRLPAVPDPTGPPGRVAPVRPARRLPPDSAVAQRSGRRPG